MDEQRYTLAEVIERIMEEESVDSLAAQFSILGINGIKEESSCPIANLVTAVADATEVSIGPVYMGAVEDGLDHSYRTPDIARQFINKFDKGYYPLLEADEFKWKGE